MYPSVCWLILSYLYSGRCRLGGQMWVLRIFPEELPLWYSSDSGSLIKVCVWSCALQWPLYLCVCVQCGGSALRAKSWERRADPWLLRRSGTTGIKSVISQMPPSLPPFKVSVHEGRLSFTVYLRKHSAQAGFAKWVIKTKKPRKVRALTRLCFTITIFFFTLLRVLKGFKLLGRFLPRRYVYQNDCHKITAEATKIGHRISFQMSQPGVSENQICAAATQKWPILEENIIGSRCHNWTPIK